MADNDQLMHFDISTPRLAQQSSGRPLALADAMGAGGNPVHGNVHMPGGAGGDSMQIRQALGVPGSFHPGRDRSVTPRRGGPLAMLRSGSSPPERGSALSVFQPGSQRQMPDGGQFGMQCTEDALRVQQQRFAEVAASYMLETK